MARVLVVDDEPQIAKLINSLLVRAGHEVHTAGDAEAAIDMCRSHASYDLVLSDISLPAMDGHELARWIAGHCPESRVILMSALDCSCHSCPYTTPCKFVPKPFQPQHVLALITEALRQPPNGL